MRERHGIWNIKMFAFIAVLAGSICLHSTAYAQAIVESYPSRFELPPSTRSLMPSELPAVPQGPTYEPQSIWPPCYFCYSAGPSPDENPGADLPTYEEMNMERDPIPPVEAVPELGD